MMRDWTLFFYKEVRLIILLLLLIIVAGYSAWTVLPRLEDPIIANRFAVIVSEYPGASAPRVEALVTEKIEDEIQGLKEIKKITSVSRPGVAVLTIQLNDDVTNADAAWSKIRDRLARVETQLPEGASEPVLDEERTYAFTKLIAVQGKKSPVPLSTLRRYAKDLRKRLQTLPGTDHVRLYGAPAEEIVVAVNPIKLRALNLSINQLSSIIRSADSKLPAGVIYQKRQDYILELSGEFLTLSRIKNIPIKTDSQGEVIRLQQIANVYQGLIEPPTALARILNQRAVVVAARIKPNQKIDFWDVQVTHLLKQFDQLLPNDIKTKVIFDQKNYTNTRLSNLRNSLVMGATLVAIILLITLGWRAASVVSLTLPLVLLMALFLLSLSGVAIHQMSIIGLIVALGLVVDNAIVMINAIRRLLLEGRTRIEAVSLATRYYWTPLLSSTLTTILAFAPIILLTGPVGEFTRGIAVSVIAALVSSYILSILVIPSVAGHLLLASEEKQGFWRSGIKIPKLTAWFRRLLIFSLRHRALTMMCTAIIPILGLLSGPLLVNQFFPRTDRNQFYIQVILPEQTSIVATEQLVARAYSMIINHPAVTSVNWFVGSSAPTFYYNKPAKRDLSPNFAEAIVGVKKIKDVQPTIVFLQKQLDWAFPNAQILVRALWQGPPFDAPIEVKIFGPSLERLQAIGNRVREILQSIPGVIHTESALKFNANKILITADEDKLRTLNLTLSDISRDLNLHLRGSISGSLLQGPEELPVRLRLAKPYRNSLNWLLSYQYNDSTLKQSNALGVPLTAYAKLKLVPSIASITRINGERVNLISGFISANVLPQKPLDKFKKRLAQAKLSLPPGYSIQYGGEAQERAEAIANLFARINVVITFAVLILVLTFNSFTFMFLIVIVAVQAIGLGLFSLAVVRYPLGFNSIIGIMGLVGVAINAAIIILSNLKRSLTNRPKTIDNVADVVIAESSRHVISTTLTTVLGFVPLLLTPGDLWPPMAVVFIGGISLTTMVSFFFTPSVYLVLKSNNKWKLAIQRRFSKK